MFTLCTYMDIILYPEPYGLQVRRSSGYLDSLSMDGAEVAVNEYATHFHDIYIDGKEGAKMTGDCMKMLMLTMPFMVRDLIAPEVHVYTQLYMVYTVLY